MYLSERKSLEPCWRFLNLNVYFSKCLLCFGGLLVPVHSIVLRFCCDKISISYKRWRKYWNLFRKSISLKDLHVYRLWTLVGLLWWWLWLASYYFFFLWVSSLYSSFILGVLVVHWVSLWQLIEILVLWLLVYVSYVNYNHIHFILELSRSYSFG